MRPLALLALVAATLSAEPLTDAERKKAIEYLQSTKAWFLKATAGLTEAQWRFKPTPEKWSVFEVAEHIAVTEDYIYETIQARLQTPPEPENRAKVTKQEERILKILPDRSRKAMAPEPVRPSGRWKTGAEVIAHFEKSRDRGIQFVATTPATLRDHFAPHFALGLFDTYQWMLFTAAHCDRHLQQLEEVKKDPNFPQ
jgi:hypothetical protein